MDPEFCTRAVVFGWKRGHRLSPANLSGQPRHTRSPSPRISSMPPTPAPKRGSGPAMLPPSAPRSRRSTTSTGLPVICRLRTRVRHCHDIRDPQRVRCGGGLAPYPAGSVAGRRHPGSCSPRRRGITARPTHQHQPPSPRGRTVLPTPQTTRHQRHLTTEAVADILTTAAPGMELRDRRQLHPRRLVPRSAGCANQGAGLETQREQARANLDMVNRESDLNTTKIQGPRLEVQRDAARE